MEVRLHIGAESLLVRGATQADFLKQLREIIARGSLEFVTWTLLLIEIEKAYPDNIETIRLVYDSFLSNFPLCYGYWRKYAEHHARLCTVEKVVEIFERAVQSATYSVGLWVEYFRFSMSAFEDPCDVRRIYKRGMSYVGKDYLCHALWDKCIEFELSKLQWSSLAHVYCQTLRFPTKKLHRYYNNFKKFTAILKEEMEHQNDSSNDSDLEAFTHKAAASTPKDEVVNVIQDLMDPNIGPRRSIALQKYICIGEQFYQEACELEEKVRCFETKIRRPYFHVQPLDNNQLENWHRYLDFVEAQQDFDWIVKHYERCLIPCANYPEFWMRYVELVESRGGREIANFALYRATQVFLKNVPAIHLFNARFKEQIGDIFGARSAFLQCDTKLSSGFIQNVVKEANMEKRLGNFAAAFHVYEKAFEMAAERKKLHTVSSLYIHFTRLKYMVTGSADSAIDVMVNGIQNVPHCKLLVEGLINFGMTHGGPKHMDMVESIIVNEISPGSDLSQGLSTEDREAISLLFLEYIDYCGTTYDMRRAWNRHIKLFPHSIRPTSFHDPTSSNQLLIVPMDERKTDALSKPEQPSGAHTSSQIQLPVAEQQLSLTNKFQSEDDDNGATGKTQQLSSNVAEHIVEEDAMGENNMICDSVPLPRSDAYEAKELILDSVNQSGEGANGLTGSTHDLMHQRRDDAPGISELIHDSKYQVVDHVESLGASQGHSDLVDTKQGPTNEFEQQLKLPSMENLTLSPQNKETRDTVKGEESPQATLASDGVLESSPLVASPKSLLAAGTSEIQNEAREYESASPSKHVPPPSNVENMNREDNTAIALKDANTAGLRDLEGQQQQVSLQQQQPSPQSEMVPEKLTGQGHSTWELALVTEDAVQAQSQHQVSVEGHGDLTAIQEWSTQPVTQSQAYNQQTSQYGYYQQQQQQQPYQDPQLLLFQHQQYLQQQPLQVQQQQNLAYMQQYQQMQQQQSFQMWQQQLQLQQQQQYHLQLQQWQQFQQSYQQQQQQEYQQQLQQTQPNSQEDYQKLQQQGYQQFLQQQQAYQQQLQQAQVQPQEGYQNLQQMAQLQHQQGYHQPQQQQQHENQQLQTWNGSYPQQGQVLSLPHGTDVPKPAQSPNMGETPTHSVGIAISTHHHQFPHGVPLPQSTSQPSLSPHSK